MPATQEQYLLMGNYASMLDEDQNINRRKCQRVVPMEVLSLGMSRTGTLSMQKALCILGYPNPYHFSSMYGNIQDTDMWMEAYNAKYKGQGRTRPGFFDQLLGHVGAVTDSPCNMYAPELIAAYPEAKVVLVERDIESWFQSINQLYTSGFDPVLQILAKLDPSWLGRIVTVGNAWLEGQMRALNLGEAQRHARSVYREHYAEIRRITPKDRLLEYKLGDGWEPLCEFLGKDVPDVPFPHLNEKESLKSVFEEMGKKAMRNIMSNLVFGISGLGVVGVGVWWALKKGKYLR